MAATDPVPPLGVDGVLGKALSLFLARLGPILLVTAAVGLVGAAVGQLLEPTFEALPAGSGPADPSTFDPAAAGLPDWPRLSQWLPALIVQLAVYAVMAGMVTLIALDAGSGVNRGLATYAVATLPVILPLFVLLAAANVAIGFGMFLFVVPGLWLLAAWSVFVPAIMMQDARFDAFGASARMTQGYRWPIVAVFVLFLAVFLLLALTGSFALLALGGGLGMTPGPVGLVLLAMLEALGGAIFACVSAAIYLRLREIKGPTAA